MANGRWVWAFGESFVSYVIVDKPVAGLASVPLPLFVDRYVIVTDIFAV